ncbi:MAG: MlaD family protein [Verrucomicrobia bacterium]|nr:MlaD family protein [Verrucomicrobiota bacterium]
MSKKVNTTSIGLFIVTGVALGVTGLLLFSTSKMFTKTRDVIVYFNDSLNGLNEGAPVKFRGVTIGSVKRVMVQFNQATKRMPSFGYIFHEDAMAERIKAGMRATLQTESLVTGVLYVGVDIDPNAPPPVLHQVEPLYPELPSEPTKTQQLFNNLASLDIKSLQTNLDGLLTQLRTTVQELKMADINAGATNLLSSVNRLVTDPDITNALASLRPTLDQYRELGAKVTGKVDPLADGVTNTLTEANRTLAQLRGVGENLRAMLAPDSPVRNDLDQALEQLAAAGQSISALADFLKQHPNALIAGRELPKSKP